jgi:hypothetical protein
MNKEQLKRQCELQMESYMLHGGVVTVCKAKAPRKSERVLSGTTKGSVYNTGRLRSFMRGSASIDKRV